MSFLSLLFWITVAAAFVAFWWQSDKIKLLTMAQIVHYCQARNLQLLDQTMVLTGLWPVYSKSRGLQLRRRYRFEFTSTGEMRNRGSVELIGRKIHTLELEAHLMPDDEESLH